MKKARKIVSIIVTLCFLLTLVPAGAFAAPKDTEVPFDDVQTTDWFYDTVQYVYDEGLMAGTGDRIFSPQQTTTRGMIVTILHRMAGSPEAEAQDFTDVDVDAWYAPAISWSIESGVGAGYGGGLFGPDDAITREQMASFLYRYAELKDYDVSAVGDLNDFADASAVSDWAEDVMSWAVGAELFAGRDNNQLAPQGLTTRAEAATILMRYCENIVEEEPDEPSDEPGVDDPSGESPKEPDTPVVEPDNPSDDNPSTDPTPEEPDEPSTEPDPTPEEPSDDEPGEISYTAPTTDNIETGTLTYEDETYEAAYVDNQLVVVAKDGVSRAAVENLISVYDAKIVGEIETIGMYQIQFAGEKTLDQLNEIITALKANTNVEDAYLNTVLESQNATIPHYPTDNWDISGNQEVWNELSPAGNNWGVEAINAPSAWKLLIDQYGDIDAIPSVNVGVLDSYIDMTHSQLQNIDTVYWYQDGIMQFLRDEHVNSTAADNAYAVEAGNFSEFRGIVHGSHVAGIIGATIDDGGINGVALNTRLHGVSIAEDRDDSAVHTPTLFSNATALANLIEDSNCKVINYSRSYSEEDRSKALRDGEKISKVLKAYLDKGKEFLIVSAAGNDSSIDANYSNFFNSVTEPEVKDRIIVVGNVFNNDGKVAYFGSQSTGTRTDVFAPGTDIYSTVSRNPNNFYKSNGEDLFYSANSEYMLMTGTSQSAPHVSGTAALVWAANPRYSGKEVKEVLLRSANISVQNASKYMIDAAYAVSMAQGKEYTITGTCGDNLFWSLDTDNNLEIVGTGAMSWSSTQSPWYRYSDRIKTIQISDDITSICEKAFNNCSAVTNVSLGNSISSIGAFAFCGLPNLKSITIPKSIGSDSNSIGEKALGYNDDESTVVEGFTIYGYIGTTAETYANNNLGIKFVDIESTTIPTQTPKITGKVKDKATAEPLSDVIINVYDKDGTGPLFTGKTDSNGAFSVEIETGGVYDLKFIKDGYDEYILDDKLLLNDVNPLQDILMTEEVEGFAGGNGSSSNPYQIATSGQLAYLSRQVENGELYSDKYFVLTSNIDLSKYDQWKPIGSNEKRFAGTFDGKGYKISNMTIVPDLGGIGVGLFGYIGNATISNIVLDNVNIQIQQTAQAVGGIAGGAYQADISNCTVSGKISVGQATASTDVMCGGIVGILGGNSNVKNCTNSADIDCGAHSAIGGIVGAAIANLNSVIRVSECKNTGNVQGGENVGEIVGLKQSTSGSQIIIS